MPWHLNCWPLWRLWSGKSSNFLWSKMGKLPRDSDEKGFIVAAQCTTWHGNSLPKLVYWYLIKGWFPFIVTWSCTFTILVWHHFRKSLLFFSLSLENGVAWSSSFRRCVVSGMWVLWLGWFLGNDRHYLPRYSMYRIFTYIYHTNWQIVGKYTIHWVSGFGIGWNEPLICVRTRLTI